MLTFEIVKKRVWKAPESPNPNTNHNVIQLLPNIKQVNDFRTNTVERFMPKVEYSIWVAKNVIPFFPIGSWVTHKTTPIIEDKAPFVYAKVLYVEEMYFQAPLHTLHSEPVCIMTSSAEFKVVKKYCPAELRLLTDKEIEIAHIRDKKFLDDQTVSPE